MQRDLPLPPTLGLVKMSADHSRRGFLPDLLAGAEMGTGKAGPGETRNGETEAGKRSTGEEREEDEAGCFGESISRLADMCLSERGWITAVAVLSYCTHTMVHTNMLVC